MGRVSLVTGGTRGIGRAISVSLKNAGYRVAASYAGNDTAAQQFQVETGIPVYKFDVANYEASEKAVKQVEKDIGPIDILVNNAGITRDIMFHKMTKQQWDEVIGTNLNGLFNVTRHVWEGMRGRKFGRVINISSINGQKGQMGQVNYSASKAGDIGFTKALAQEGARSGITVNVVCPGYIATDMVKAVPQDVLEKNILPHIPVGRLGEPEEIARCVVFLASEEAGFITGSTLTA
ncbi:MAG: acetoacetyl-CoA reductase, partial [Hyphomicrobium sp.]